MRSVCMGSPKNMNITMRVMGMRVSAHYNTRGRTESDDIFVWPNLSSEMDRHGTVWRWNDCNMHCNRVRQHIHNAHLRIHHFECVFNVLRSTHFKCTHEQSTGQIACKYWVSLARIHLVPSVWISNLRANSMCRKMASLLAWSTVCLHKAIPTKFSGNENLF